MPRNIVIFSDGTGQRGGQNLDENRSNIYKLYRATRCGPESSVNPNMQFAYYDPGIGSLPKGIGYIWAIWIWLYNLISQATGLGITRNIIDCYAEIIRNWRPGDRIFLIGFSRGAYTARCVGAVIALCGVPTRMPDGTPLKCDEATSRKIAAHAVKKIYQHVSSPKDKKYVPQRKALAVAFRKTYGSGSSDHPNVYPHFIGVFETVSSVANKNSMIVSLVVYSLMLISLSVSADFLNLLPGYDMKDWMFIFFCISLCFFVISFVMANLKFAWNLEGFEFWDTVHFTSPRMRFVDTQLNQHVGWARHALAIDECRADFERVPWSNSSAEQRQVGEGEPEWFQQIWFVGCHSDIGGSYPESESRLSDIALNWMVNEAQSIPNGLIIDQSILRLYPSSDGMQHDETRSIFFRFAGKKPRKIDQNAPLHESVYQRFSEEAVLQYNLYIPYRPESLKNHKKLEKYY